MKLILSEDEKRCIENVGCLVLTGILIEDFKIVKPYYVIIENGRIIIKDSRKVNTNL